MKEGYRMRMILQTLWKVLDVMFLMVGMSLLFFGVYLIYIPAGYITAGLCFMALAFLVAKKQSRGR